MLEDPDVSETVHLEGEGSTGPGTARPEGRREAFISQAPLHEGCRNRILRSGSVGGFSRRKLEPMGSGLARNGKGPAHLSFCVPHEKEQAGFELVQNRCDATGGETGSLGDELEGERVAGARNFDHNRIPHLVMLAGHECEPGRAGLERCLELSSKGLRRLAADFCSTADKNVLCHRRDLHFGVIDVPMYHSGLRRPQLFQTV